MEHDDLKLPVNLESIQEELQHYVANIEKTDDDTFSGNWIHDGRVYENVVIPFRLGFMFEGGDGSNCDAHLDYTVYYEVDDSDSLFNGLLGVIEDAEIMALRDDISIIEMHDQKERVSFYDLEIV